MEAVAWLNSHCLAFLTHRDPGSLILLNPVGKVNFMKNENDTFVQTQLQVAQSLLK